MLSVTHTRLKGSNLIVTNTLTDEFDQCEKFDRYGNCVDGMQYIDG